MDTDLSKNIALEALDTCDYMVLAMTDPEGLPYCVPLNGVRVGEVIYFHSRRTGTKLDCLRQNPAVCLTAVGSQRVVQAEYETHFTSAVAQGYAEEVTDPEKMRAALRAICARYAPDCPGRVEEVIEKHLSHTSVWEVRMESLRGRKKP